MKLYVTSKYIQQTAISRWLVHSRPKQTHHYRYTVCTRKSLSSNRMDLHVKLEVYIIV